MRLQSTKQTSPLSTTDKKSVHLLKRYYAHMPSSTKPCRCRMMAASQCSTPAEESKQEAWLTIHNKGAQGQLLKEKTWRNAAAHKRRETRNHGYRHKERWLLLWQHADYLILQKLTLLNFCHTPINRSFVIFKFWTWITVSNMANIRHGQERFFFSTFSNLNKILLQKVYHIAGYFSVPTQLFLLSTEKLYLKSSGDGKHYNSDC